MQTFCTHPSQIVLTNMVRFSNLSKVLHRKSCPKYFFTFKAMEAVSRTKAVESALQSPW